MSIELTETSIRKVADLARLDLTDTEVTKFTSQLGQILSYIDQLNKVDTSNVTPMSHAIEMPTPLRADELRSENPYNPELMLESAPEQIYENYKVPQVIGGE